MRSAENAAAAPFDRASQPREVPEGMKLPLVGEPERGAGLERHAGDARHSLDATDPGASSGRRLRVQLRVSTVLLGEPVTVHALEVAFDPFVAHDGLDAIDGGDVTFGGETGSLRPVHLLDLGVEIVERGA